MKQTTVYSKVYSGFRSIYFLALQKFSGGFLSLLFLMLFNPDVEAQKYKGHFFNNLNEQGVILDGYDPVAFFTENKPVKGDAKFQYRYEEANYYFSSEQNLETFKKDPDKYKPQFGGWCAYAVSLGHIAPIDINTFSIVDGRLVVQHNQRAVNGWNKDVQGNLKLADKYWPVVSAHGGEQIRTDDDKKFLNNVDAEGLILNGYDVVSYFSAGGPVNGNQVFTARYHGATYHFANEANASMFKDNPEKYAPRYGSYCGYAMSLGKLRPVDPLIYDILNDRLVLQHTREAYDLFHKDLDNNIAKADQHWPVLQKKYAHKKPRYDKPAKPAVASR